MSCIFCQLRPLLRSTLRVPRPWPQKNPPPTRRSFIRPTFAPKPLPDIKHIAQNPGLYEQNCIDRDYPNQAQNSWKILELRKKRADLQNNNRELRQTNKKVQAQIKDSSADGRPPQELLERAKALKDELAMLDEREQMITEEIMELALVLPNLSGPHAPSGTEPTVLTIHEGPGLIAKRDTSSLVASHTDIGAALDILDFSAGNTSSGWGWYFLKDGAAMLEQALVQYTLELLRRRGYRIVAPPSVVYGHVAAACGFQPRDQNDEQQIYNLAQPDKDVGRKAGLCLAGTAEIPLAAMKANATLDAAELPLKVAAMSRCFRAEAGARGVDTKGLYRVHEFTKVEMFAWTLPDASAAGQEKGGYFEAPGDGPSQAESVFEEMLAIQQEILQALGLSYRALEMPPPELGATATRKVDVEAFFPSRRDKDEGWGEVTSASICTDYQARRLGTRLETKSGSLDYPYTLNATALAVPRIIAALLEMGFEEGVNGAPGSVVVPECLRQWMGGTERITRYGS